MQTSRCKTTRKNAASLWFYDAARRYATTKDPRIKFAAVFGSGEIVKDLPSWVPPWQLSGKTRQDKRERRSLLRYSGLNRLRRSTLNRVAGQSSITIVYEERMLAKDSIKQTDGLTTRNTTITIIFITFL